MMDKGFFLVLLVFLIAILLLGIVTYSIIKRRKVLEELYEASSKPPKIPKV